MPSAIVANIPVIVPAAGEKTYDKLWITRLTCELRDPNEDGLITVELHPYCVLEDGTKELAPRNPRKPVRRIKRIEGVFARAEKNPKLAQAIETILEALRGELEAE